MLKVVPACKVITFSSPKWQAVFDMMFAGMLVSYVSERES